MSNKIVETNLEISDWFSWVDSNKYSIDLWITDPPYPFSNQNGTGRFDYKSGSDGMYSRLDWPSLGDIFLKMFDRSNAGARAYVFCNRDGLFKTKELLESAGWKFRNLLVWDKKNLGMGYHWRNKAEYIVYVSNGKPLTYIKNKGNIFSYKKPRGGGTSQKPHEIWADILESGSVSGDVCADPFSGTNPMRESILNHKGLESKIGAAYTNIY